MKRVMLAAFASLFAASGRAQGQPAPKYAAKVPPSIQTPDTVQTRIGMLKFFDGLPDEETVKKVYDNLDFARGVEAFMAGMPRGLGLRTAAALVRQNLEVGDFELVMWSGTISLHSIHEKRRNT